MTLDDFTVSGDRSNRQHPYEFEEEVRRADLWPSPPNRNTKQLMNLAGVLYRLRYGTRVTKDQFKDARDAESQLAREIDPSLGYDYWKTVHAHCVRDLGYEGDGAVDEFVADARRFLRRR
jgi:hypothetical protein